MANNVQDAKNKAQDAAGKTGEAARDLGHDAAQKARDIGHEAAQKARDIGHDLSNAGHSVATAAGKTAENVTARAGEGIASLAGTVREYGPRQGAMGSATETVAHSLEQGGQYLQNEGLSGMANDLTEMVKRNPIPALLVGVGVGFVLARLTSSRS